MRLDVRAHVYRETPGKRTHRKEIDCQTGALFVPSRLTAVRACRFGLLAWCARSSKCETEEIKEAVNIERLMIYGWRMVHDRSESLRGVRALCTQGGCNKRWSRSQGKSDDSMQ